MKKIFQTTVFVFAMVFLSSGPTSAQMGCPDINSSYVIQIIQTESALLVMPDGSGPPLSEAREFGGAHVDATIYLTLVSNCPPTGPMVNIPAEDMWLESNDGSLVFCAGGSIADAPTDDQGNTTWSRPLSGGGWSLGWCDIMIGGALVIGRLNDNLNFNSPDLNADLVVNLTDISEFAQDFYGSQYAFRSDLHFDYVVNLSDLAVMSGAIGKSCP